jgi:hypothetical protein
MEIRIGPSMLEEARSNARSFKSLLRALKRTRAPLTAFGMTICFLEKQLFLGIRAVSE